MVISVSLCAGVGEAAASSNRSSAISADRIRHLEASQEAQTGRQRPPGDDGCRD